MSLKYRDNGLKLNHISFFINLYSSIKFAPYRLVWLQEDREISTKTSLSSKVFCIVMHSITALFNLRMSLIALLDLFQRGVGDFLALHEAIKQTTFSIMICHQIYFWWWCQPCFLKLINTIHPYFEFGCCVNTKKRNKVNFFVGFALAILNFIVAIILEIEFQACRLIGEQFADALVRIVLGWEMKWFYLHEAIKYSVAFVLLIAGSFQMFQLGAIIVVLIGIKQVWANHRRQIQRPDLSYETGISLYAEIKECLEQFNDLFAVPMLLIYLENLIDFASLPQYLDCESCSLTKKITSRSSLLCYVVLTITIWTLSSQLHDQVQSTMRSWIYGFHHIKNDPRIFTRASPTQLNLTFTEQRIKLLTFMTEVETEGMGVSCKFFVINYNTFRSTIGLIVTYAIVFHQFMQST